MRKLSTAFGKIRRNRGAERLAALEQAGDDDPNDRDLEPEW